MKSNRFAIAAVLVTVAVVTFAGPCGAQSEMTANIPFGFVACDRAMPAGVYHVRPVAHGSTVWQLVSAQSSIVLGVKIPLDNKVSDPPRMVFQHMGGEYFLSEIHARGDWQLPSSKRQQELSKAQQQRPTTREVALR